MKILIDGDGCPVIDLALEIARRYAIEVIIFCDTSHHIEKVGAVTKMVTKGSDAVDFMLVNEAQAEDVVVTQDYGLAAMVLAKKAQAINQNGLIFSDDNLSSLLFSRHVAKEVRRQGGRTKGPKKRDAKQNEAFKASFTKLLEAHASVN